MKKFWVGKELKVNKSVFTIISRTDSITQVYDMDVKCRFKGKDSVIVLQNRVKEKKEYGVIWDCNSDKEFIYMGLNNIRVSPDGIKENKEEVK